MSIVFEPLVDAPTYGGVSCRAKKDRVLTGTPVANGVYALAKADGVKGSAALRATVSCAPRRDIVRASRGMANGITIWTKRDGVKSTSISVVPHINLVSGFQRGDGVAATGYCVVHGSVYCAESRDRVRAMTGVFNGVIVQARADRVQGYETPDYVASVFIRMTGGYMYMPAYETQLAMAYDGSSVRGEATNNITFQLFEAARIKDSNVVRLTGTAAIADAAAAGDVASTIWLLVAEANAVAADDATAYLDLLLEAADVAMASGLATTQLTANAVIAQLAAIYDTTLSVEGLFAADAIAGIDAATAEFIALLAEAMTAATALDSADTTMRMVLLASDASAAVDGAATTLDALVQALDEGRIVGTVRVGDDEYAMYAMTMVGAAVSEYAGMGFNSVATINGRLYGASDQGLFLAEGNDDAGAPINAKVRVGLTALGTQLMKAVPSAYVGYTSDGVLLFKVSTTDKGVKRTNVYTLNPVRKDVVSDNRFTISKGLHSVYWDFELANSGGADFELDTIKVWRMPLTRRK